MSRGDRAMRALFRWGPKLAMAAALLLVAGGIALGFYNDRDYRSEKVAETLSEAHILAATVTAALTFDDATAANEYVAALRANPQVTAAAVYDRTGLLFASFSRSARDRPPPRVGLGPPIFADGRVEVTAPVIEDGAVLGTVYLESITEPLFRRVQRYGFLTLLVLMAALVAAALGAAQAALTRANQSLEAANAELRAEIAQREKAEAALRQAQKMEAIGQLTGGVAHDFNNLLQVILASLDTVVRRLDQGGAAALDRIRRQVETAIRASERAASLTQRLLAFARRQPLAPRPLDLNKLVQGMSDLLYRTLGERIAVETVLAAGLWPSFADAGQLENALLNLALNARDAMPEGGHLTIETANVYLDEVYAAAVEELRPGQYVMVSVADDGAGMEPEVAQKAFDPFFTTKDVGQGTGLGLSQVYGFVKQSGGHVRIYSEPGQGTTVKLYLPRHLPKTAEPPAPEAAEALPQGAEDELVLVVEDQPEVRDHTVEMLRDLGYGVAAAADGAAALEVLERAPEVRLLFTDVGLPGTMNGRQLADRARAAHPALKVLYTTGYARNAIVHNGRLDPGVELISKPFSRAALAKKVRAVLDAASGEA